MTRSESFLCYVMLPRLGTMSFCLREPCRIVRRRFGRPHGLESLKNMTSQIKVLFIKDHVINLIKISHREHLNDHFFSNLPLK